MSTGSKITIKNGVLNVPDDPIIPFVEGDGTGRGYDMMVAAQQAELVKEVETALALQATHGNGQWSRSTRSASPTISPA